jgi:hypothetical protein
MKNTSYVFWMPGWAMSRVFTSYEEAWKFAEMVFADTGHAGYVEVVS